MDNLTIYLGIHLQILANGKSQAKHYRCVYAMIFVATLLVIRLHKSGLWPWISWIFSATVFKFTAVVSAPGPTRVMWSGLGPAGARATVWVWAEEKCKITNLKAINQVSQLSRHVSRDCHECQAVTCDKYLVRLRSLWSVMAWTHLGQSWC